MENSTLWLLGGNPAYVKLGEVSLLLQNGSTAYLKFSNSREELFSTFERDGYIYLVTKLLSDVFIYRLELSATNSNLSLVNSKSLIFSEEGRVIQSPLVDFYYDLKTDSFFLLTLSHIKKFRGHELFDGSMHGVQVRLPTLFGKHTPRPVAFFPWQSKDGTTNLEVFQASYTDEYQWRQEYVVHSDTLKIKEDESYFSGEYLATFQNRNSSLSKKWLIQDRNLIDSQTLAKLNNPLDGYGIHLFQDQDNLLVTTNGQGTVWKSKSGNSCWLFQTPVTQSMMFHQKSPMGDQTVFLGITESNQLLKAVFYNESSVH